MTTPPGWYPDPRHTGQGPAPERWWDGSAWTDHTREVIGGAGPSYGPPLPGRPDAARSRRSKIVAVVAAAAVVIGAIVGGIVLLNDDGDDSGGGIGIDGPSNRPSDVPGPDGQSGGDGSGGGDSGGQDGGPGGPSDLPTGPPPSGGDPDIAVDIINGITLPVLDGWQAGTNAAGGASVTTRNSYPCPGASSIDCVPGGAFSTPASGYGGKTAKAVAKEDIAECAEASYGKDPDSKKEIYGGISSHKQLKSEAVTVAGRKGYLVRWKVVTKKGADGIVQSLAFPSPTVSDTMVVVRFGFDDGGHGAPPVGDMDRIVKGIKALGSGDGDTGDGQSV